MITADTITDEQIRTLRDGEQGLLDETLRQICRVALRFGQPKTSPLRPFCNVCGWRKGGPDSWDGHRCKCGLIAMTLWLCGSCGGMGTVPYNIGSQPCGSCDGSGIVDSGERLLARARCAEILNACGVDGVSTP